MLNHTCLISIINTVLDSDQSELTAFLSLPLIYSKTHELMKNHTLHKKKKQTWVKGQDFSLYSLLATLKVNGASVLLSTVRSWAKLLWTSPQQSSVCKPCGQNTLVDSKKDRRKFWTGSKTKKLTFDFLSLLLDDLLLFVSSQCPASSTSPGNLSVIWIHLA